jgi:hypothetical protein
VLSEEIRTKLGVEGNKSREEGWLLEKTELENFLIAYKNLSVLFIVEWKNMGKT